MFPQRFSQKPQTHFKVRSNEQIRVPQIRLIGVDGEQIGIIPTKDGLRRAEEAGLDLVEVAPLAKPPVCRILDIGKYLYALEKKEKEARKKQKVILVKEVKLTSKIEEHDYQTKLRSARKFIAQGDKVKMSMVFRGREMTHTEIGKRILNRYKEDLSDIAELEKNDGFEGNTLHIYFVQKAAAKKLGKENSAPVPRPSPGVPPAASPAPIVPPVPSPAPESGSAS